MKRFCAISITVLLMFSMFGFPASAAESPATVSGSKIGLGTEEEAVAVRIHIANEKMLQPSELAQFFSEADAEKIVAKTKERIAKEVAKGYEYAGTTFILLQHQKDASSKSTAFPYYVMERDVFNDSEVLNDESEGMYFWLDMAWDIVVGESTSYILRAADILGLSPSDFRDTWVEGDLLERHTTKVYNYRHYMMYNEMMNRDCWYYDTYQLITTEYLDLYTVNLSGLPVRESDEKTFYHHTEHYFDESWIENYVRQACQMNWATAFDRIP